MTMTSKSMQLYGIFAALAQAQTELGGGEWTGTTDEHKQLADWYLACTPEMPHLSRTELAAVWGADADAVNEFFKGHGFGDLKLKPFWNQTSIGVGSVISLPFTWRTSGRESTIGGHKAVKTCGFQALKSAQQGAYAAQIFTTDGDIVTMVELPDGGSLKGLEMVKKAKELSKAFNQPVDDFESLKFPMIDYSKGMDLPLVLGMSIEDTEGTPWKVRQAVQQNVFRMNPLGGEMRSGFAAEIRTLGISNGLVIDKPFLVWINRPNMSLPLFVGWMAQDAWLRA